MKPFGSAPLTTNWSVRVFVKWKRIAVIKTCTVRKPLEPHTLRFHTAEVGVARLPANCWHVWWYISTSQRDKFWCFEETFRPFSPLCIRWLGTPYIFAVAFTQGWHSLVTAWQKIGQRMGLLALTTGTSSLHWQITAFHTSAKLHHCFHSVLHLDSIVWRLFQLSPSGFGAPIVAREDLLSRTLGARYPMKISDRDTFLALGPHYAAEEVCG